MRSSLPETNVFPSAEYASADTGNLWPFSVNLTFAPATSQRRISPDTLSLPPEEASEWLERVVYKAIIAFQREVADGGNQAALVVWITENRRLDYQTSDDTYNWHCGTEYRGQTIPLSRCLFNGAENDLRRIHVTTGKNTEHWIGLYHPRIS